MEDGERTEHYSADRNFHRRPNTKLIPSWVAFTGHIPRRFRYVPTVERREPGNGPPKEKWQGNKILTFLLCPECTEGNLRSRRTDKNVKVTECVSCGGHIPEVYIGWVLRCKEVLE